MAEDNKIKVKKEIKTYPYKFFLWQVFLFSLTLILGITASLKLNKISTIQNNPLPPLSFWWFIFYFLLATFFIFSLVKFVKFKRRKRILFRFIFILTLFWGTFLLFGLWTSDFFALAFTFILIFAWFKNRSVLIHNLVVILSLAGIGSVLGLQLVPQTVILLLLVLSIYDFVAVYKTKHMVIMAKEMIKSGVVPGLIIPQEISDIKKKLKEVKPGGKFLILGGGDVIFPLLLCVSLVPEGVFISLIVAFFTLIGLFLSFWIFISRRSRQPMPALPPIALFSIIGFLITRLV
jgi:presenilin-like A22 family membrane protease